MMYLRWLLLPFSFLYGGVIRCRHLLYDRGWFGFETKSFDLPLIVVGNLEVGGTGKTPMTEYLIRLLQQRYNLATLSRGYGRSSRGYLEVHTEMSADQSGDEPLQFKKKFPHITVAVSEKRVPAVEKLQPAHDVIILDDAYQHRAIQPGLSILLFSYDRVLETPWLLPTGPYRDVFSARRRVDLMVVTKCPEKMTENEVQKIQQQLHVSGKDIPVFFSHIAYATLRSLWGEDFNGAGLDGRGLHTQQVLLVTGIAQPQSLVAHMESQAIQVRHLAFPDHHSFTEKDLQKIKTEFEQLEGLQKIIVTTEKDAMRIQSLPKPFIEPLKGLPIYYLPIEQQFKDPEETSKFDQLILKYVANILKLPRA